MEMMTEAPEDDEPPFGEDDFQSLVGRPSLFNEETTNRVIEAVERGSSFSEAAAYAGISYSSLNRWRKKGLDCDDEEDEYRQFWKRLEQAKGQAALRLLDCINSAAEGGDWKAATWILERRYPKNWGPNGCGPDPLEPLFPYC